MFQPDGDAAVVEILFALLDRIFAEVEDAGGQSRFGLAGREDFVHVLQRTGAAAGDDGDIDGGGDGGGHLDIIAALGTVGVHDVEDDFPGAVVVAFPDPFHHFNAGGSTAAVDVHLPEFLAVFPHAVGVDGQHDALAAETQGRALDQIPIFHRRRIDADLIRAAVEHNTNIVDVPNPAADRQRHKDALGALSQHVHHEIAVFVAGGDVVKDQLVGALFVVPKGALGDVAGVPVLEELHAFDHPTLIDIQAGYDSFC